MRWAAPFLGSMVAAAWLLGAGVAFAAEARDDTDALRTALSGAAGRIVAARTAVAEFYVSQGRPPTNSAEAGLPPPSRSEAVHVSIEAAGVIRLAIATAELRPGSQVYLVPRFTSQGIAWSCVSPDAAIAAIVTGCRFQPSYEPAPETPASLEAKANPQVQFITIEGRRFRIDPLAYISGRTDTIDPNWETGLSAQGREQLIDAVLASLHGRIARLDELLYLSAWLQSVGPDVLSLLERHLEDEPSIAAASLLAICGVGPRLFDRLPTQPCLAASAPSTAIAIEEINRRVEQQLRDPTDHPYWTPRGVADCHGAIAVVAALGAAARPVAASLGGLLGDRRPHDAPGSVDLCRQRDIVVTLLRMLLAVPIDRAPGDLIDAAALELVRLTLFEYDRDASPARLGALMDARDMRGRLHYRLKTDVARWIERCVPVAYSASARIADLGVLGFDALVPLLDARGDNPACDPGSSALNALGPLIAAYPREAAARYFTARGAPTRDDFITAALTLREAADPDLNGKLDDLLARTGYQAIEVDDGRVTFPGAPHLAWSPYADWRLPLAGPPADTAASRSAYRDLAAGSPNCRIPVDDEDAWRSVQGAKRLFVFACDESEVLIVIGSPAGFKVMRLPERLAGMPISSDAILGVGDADHDGNLEVLLVQPCDGRDPDCADGRVPDTYALVEEDGDWFTWFRVPSGRAGTEGQPKTR